MIQRNDQKWYIREVKGIDEDEIKISEKQITDNTYIRHAIFLEVNH